MFLRLANALTYIYIYIYKNECILVNLRHVSICSFLASFEKLYKMLN